MKSKRTGKYPGEKTDRNTELYKDYKKGMMIIDIVAKYRITSTRIYQIVNQMEKIERLLKVMPDVLNDNN